MITWHFRPLMKDDMNISKPTRNNIERLLKKYKDDYFPITDTTLSKIFKTFPYNRDVHEVLIKVVMLNRLYNTNIIDPYPVAEHITSLSIDEMLSKGVLNIVTKIAEVKFHRKKWHLYSFATKYCSWHFPEKFFIYDSIVDHILWEYKKRYNFASFFRYELKDYERYHDILLNFIDFFELDDISKKRLDEFLWLEGLKVLDRL